VSVERTEKIVEAFFSIHCLTEVMWLSLAR
jgi:hypothetical protein